MLDHSPDPIAGLTYLCGTCAQPYEIGLDSPGVANHINDGGIDYDADADHTPLGTDRPSETTPMALPFAPTTYRSAVTAHLSFAYPYGRSVRCVRREWVERSTHASKKMHQERFVTQTTHESFNREYTAMIAQAGLDEANAWAHALITQSPNLVRWNAAKASTYSRVVVIVEKPLDDTSGRIGVTHAILPPYAGPAEAHAFKTAHKDALDPIQLALIERLIAYATHRPT